ncbi:hypothetical protein [Maribacter sp. ACAM166]|uniref:hypothetical protein n=1 Tax=Maribacter sp. ACAM166 TaxID=2508996 RepID=UPI0010FD80E1|nr:hypothetical protein [Maribacter sp. ACAM166]TLP81447.1 hypothetical protein ES765_05420 [Maribacter sp. ACAM166]
MLLKKSITYSAFIILIMLLGCSSTKQNKQNTNPSSSGQNSTQVHSSTGYTATTAQDYGSDDHSYISQDPVLETPILSNTIDSLTQIGTSMEENENVSQAILGEEFTNSTILESKSLVAEKIVENYLNSANKEPGGHCLSVSKGRFEQAYKEVHGHLPYQDLPNSMATKLYTSKQAFNLLYASATDTHPKWLSLPEEYRGKGNAGAIAYAGMGTLVDTTDIWSGQLKPGALMQVWRYKEDYEQVVKGVDVQKLDPYGHSFIFIGYVRNENDAIIGLKIADQGFQSYRPLVPRDYDVWWAVNLSI